MLKIAEVAEILGVSKVTTYKYLKDYKAELRGHLKTLKGVKHLTNEGFELLNSLINSNPNIKDDLNPPNDYMFKLLISAKDNEINHLKTLLKERDNFINKQADLLQNAQELHMGDKKHILMLEHKIDDYETTENQQTESFFSRFFKFK